MIISGKVKDYNGYNLDGVNIYPKDQDNFAGQGGITNADGEFNIDLKDVQDDTIIVFSYLGYTTIEKPARLLKNYTVLMSESDEMLDEVVITATVPKKQTAELPNNNKTKGLVLLGVGLFGIIATLVYLKRN